MIRVVNTETRPLRADAERNRKRLLDAAAEVFAEHGLEASTAEIARRAGVGQGTVFRRFPTKDDLVAAIVVDRLVEITERRARAGRRPAAGGRACWRSWPSSRSMHVRDRGLIEAVNGTRALADPAVHDAHGELLDVLEEVVKRRPRGRPRARGPRRLRRDGAQQGRGVGMRARHRAPPAGSATSPSSRPACSRATRSCRAARRRAPSSTVCWPS